ncbi:hypothetical protein BASA81_007349 [Batrachochytrium salamandrivorans]|nr:hypothetical protein BASA81_007349 [Batrachochytrium salamandrivorans]
MSRSLPKPSARARGRPGQTGRQARGTPSIYDFVNNAAKARKFRNCFRMPWQAFCVDLAKEEMEDYDESSADCLGHQVTPLVPSPYRNGNPRLKKFTFDTEED